MGKGNSMADEIDEANACSELAMKVQEDNIRANASKLEVEETGSCLSCGRKLKGRRWCDADCRDDWQRDNR